MWLLRLAAMAGQPNFTEPTNMTKSPTISGIAVKGSEKMRLRFPPKRSQRDMLGSAPGSQRNPKKGNNRVWGDLHMESSTRWPGQAREKGSRFGKKRHTNPKTKAEKTAVWPIHLVVSSSGIIQRARGLSMRSGRSEKKTKKKCLQGLPWGLTALWDSQRWYPSKLNPTWPKTNKSPSVWNSTLPLIGEPASETMKAHRQWIPHYFGPKDGDCPLSHPWPTKEDNPKTVGGNWIVDREGLGQ